MRVTAHSKINIGRPRPIAMMQADGIILTVPAILRSFKSSGSIWHLSRSHYLQFAPDFLDLKYDLFESFLDRNPYTFTSKRGKTTQDLLWVSTWIGVHNVIFDFILLTWEGDIASRAGVVVLTLPYHCVDIFLSKAEIKYSTFWFS
jgi:hypothetical protein